MKPLRARSRPRSVQAGLALLEVLISVTLLAIGALAVLVVNGSLIAASTVGHQRAEAALLAQELIVMATTDPTQAGCYATVGQTACASSLARQGLENWQARVRARIPGVLAEGVSSEYAADQTFTVTVQWRSARSDQTRNLRLATHLGS
jgi:Tfp pilus assembly protein PilV